MDYDFIINHKLTTIKPKTKIDLFNQLKTIKNKQL